MIISLGKEESRLRAGWRAFTRRINDFELFKVSIIGIAPNKESIK